MHKGNDSPDGDIFGTKGGIRQFIRLSAVRAKPDPQEMFGSRNGWAGEFCHFLKTLKIPIRQIKVFRAIDRFSKVRGI